MVRCYDKLAQEAWGFDLPGPTLAGLEGCGLGLRQARPGGLGFGPAGPTLAGLEGCGLGLRQARQGGLGFWTCMDLLKEDLKDVVWGYDKLAREAWVLDLPDLL